MAADENADGLRRGKVRLEQADPEAWAQRFAREAASIRACLGPRALDIQHFGSTAIPGIEAKPIVDIAVAVHDYEEAADCVPALERLGYVYLGEYGIRRRYFFTKGDPVLIHVHVFERQDENWENLVLFRDHMRAYPDAAEAYEALKQDLAQRFPDDRESYQQGKGAFIADLLARVRSAAD